jgi:hypothetical protein
MKLTNEPDTQPASPAATSRPPVIVTGALTEKKRGSRKKSTAPRTRKPKPQAIIDIDKAAAEAKAKYRLAQKSGGILTRIHKLVPRLCEDDQSLLLEYMGKIATPKLL